MKRAESKKRYKKRNVIYVETKYGDFIDESEYGMTQQKNAMSEKELIKYGFKLIK